MRTDIKITIIFFLMIMLPVVLTFYFSFDSLNKELVPNIEGRHFKEASNIFLSIDTLLYNTYLDVQGISANPALKGGSSNTIKGELLKYTNKYKSLSFSDLNGIKIADTKDRIGESEVRDFSLDKGFGFYYSPNTRTVFVSHVVTDGDPIGIVSAEMGLEEIEGLLPTGGYVALFDRNKNILATNDPLYKINQRIRDLPSVKNALNGEEGIKYELNPYHGEEVLTAYLDDPGYRNFASEWYITYSISKNVAFATLFSLVNSFMFFVIGIGILAIFASYLLSQQLIVKPISELKKVTREAIAGKEVTVPAGMKGEVGELAVSFNRMISDLADARKRVEEYSKTLEHKVGMRTQEVEKSRMAMLNAVKDLDKTNEELMNTQNRLKKGYKKLRDVNKEKDKFISIAAHELKTPLAAIHGFAELLQKETIIKNAKQRNNFLNIITDQSSRLSDLVTEVLELSRIDIGTIRYDFKRLSIINLIEDIRKIMSIPIKNKGLKAEYQIEKNLPDIIGDKDRLTQVLVNLLTNSTKYTLKGKITVRAYRDGENVHMAVSDTGIGIPKEHIGKLFQRFYQVPNELTKKIQGTGLGLSLCKEFVEAHRGKIWAESKGKGSTFHVLLPLAAKKLK